MDKGDVVRVIGEFSKENNYELVLDDIPSKEGEVRKDKARFVIVEPEILVPSTTISTSSPCPRVPLLRELFKNAEGSPNYPLILGNIVHLVFQKILENMAGNFILIFRSLHRQK
jgi:hypothetical protein